MMRVLAATTVIFSHSYLIADGNEKAEPFVRLLGETNILGIYGVFVFFFISGFLVTRSAASSSSVVSFAVKRVLRIYPALIVCCLLSAGILGSIFTSVALSDYWSWLLPLRYTVKTAMLPFTGWQVPTVSFPSFGPHTLNEGMNGSLWTISQELYAYLIVAILLFLGWLNFRVIAGIAAVLALVGVAIHFTGSANLPSQIAEFVIVVPYFFAGSLVYFVRERWGLSGRLAIAICILILLSGFTGYFMLGFLLAAYPVLWFATTDKIQLPALEKVGDISYGLYLYGWPLLQATRVILGDYSTPLLLFLVAWPTTAVLGYLSWHLLEKRALALAPTLSARLSQGGKAFRRGRTPEVP
ncbi:acyltransferase [Rhizobium sp. TH2]|uniref:acyltransferase family protein n=1 Tax=Rhizobium sp. TH2 TaxID=2775403 RepID=UPI00215821B1|nr:acyltransferase [Rhizobium sp. TH2]UVC11650.1 acyltransferase [Rhizobium sp. TH2]